MNNKDFYLDDIKTSLADFYQAVVTAYAVITDVVDKPAYVRSLLNEEVCKLGTLSGMITVEVLPHEFCFTLDLTVIENKTAALCLHYSVTLGDTAVHLAFIIDGVERDLQEFDLHNGLFITDIVVAGRPSTLSTISNGPASELTDNTFKRAALVLDAVTTKIHLENLKLHILDERILKRIAVLLDSPTATGLIK